jgi:hypothetical protein
VQAGAGIARTEGLVNLLRVSVVPRGAGPKSILFRLRLRLAV